MIIEFIGHRKTPIVTKFHADGIKCDLGYPDSCILEVGRNVTEKVAKKIMSDNPDWFVDITPKKRTAAKT